MQTRKAFPISWGFFGGSSDYSKIDALCLVYSGNKPTRTWEKHCSSGNQVRKSLFQHVRASSAPAPVQEFLSPISHYPPGKMKAEKAASFIPDCSSQHLTGLPNTKSGKSVTEEPKGCRNWDFTCEYTPGGKCTQNPHVLGYKHQSSSGAICTAPFEASAPLL